MSLKACVAAFSVVLPLASAAAEAPAASQSISVLVFEEPAIYIVTPGSAVGRGLIDELTRPDGSKIALPSPSYLFAKALREKLNGRLAAPISDVPNALLPQHKGKPLAPSVANTLEVFTDFNYLGYRPLAWATYQYAFAGRARLIGSDGSVLWERKCKISPTKNDPARQLGRAEFKSDEGHKLVDIVTATTAQCAELLAAQVG